MQERVGLYVFQKDITEIRMQKTAGSRVQHHGYPYSHMVGKCRLLLHGCTWFAPDNTSQIAESVHQNRFHHFTTYLC
jgi:hypothetical protein